MSKEMARNNGQGLPQPTLEIFDLQNGQQEFRRVFEPMYGTLSLRAYDLVLSGQRQVGKPVVDEQSYFVKQNGTPPRGERLLKRLDRNFYAALTPAINHNSKDTEVTSSPLTTEDPFNSQKLTEAEVHYNALLQAANTLTPYIISELFEGHGDMLRNRNEIVVPSSKPSKMLRRATGNSVNERLQHEARTQGGLLLLAGELYADSRNIALQNHLSDMQDTLDTHFFDGEIGEAVTHTTHWLYDNMTNRAIGMDGKLPEGLEFSADTHHWKEHKHQVRKIKGLDNVHALYDVDIKTWQSALAKVLRRAVEAQREEGTNTIDTSIIRDTLRMRVVVEGTTSPDDPMLDTVLEKLTDTLSEHSGNIEKVERKDNSQGNKAQVETLPYKRIFVTYKGTKKPVEIMVIDEKTYNIDQYDAGEEEMTRENIEQQLGLAHSLFEKHRLIQLLPLLMPRDILGYNHGHIDLIQIAIDNYNAERQKLSLEGRVDEETAGALNERNFVDAGKSQPITIFEHAPAMV